MPPIKSTAFKCYTHVVSTILSLSEIMPFCSRCSKAGLVYITIVSPFGRQLSLCAECTKVNMRSLYNVCSISNSKCTRLVYF